MNIALVTTSINDCRVLRNYARIRNDAGLDNYVRFFVAIDEKTPDLNPLAEELGNMEIVHGGEWKSSEMIGWNTDSRRNFAVLAALKWGADILISVDDDMVPLDDSLFLAAEHMLSRPFSGLQLGATRGWIDAGQLTVPPARQRGLPTFDAARNIPGFVDGVAVGAWQGVILGVPDTDAATVIANAPLVHSATDILRHGFVASINSRAVFNSQWTAFRRELAPAFFQHYAVQGRNTDIIASLIMRRIMRDRGLYTLYGPPFAFHNRTLRDPLKDLQAEIWGLTHVSRFAQELDDMVYLPTDKPVAEQVRHIAGSAVLEESREVIKAWCDDCEAVL